jgi:hypothetical protein
MRCSSPIRRIVYPLNKKEKGFPAEISPLDDRPRAFFEFGSPTLIGSAPAGGLSMTNDVNGHILENVSLLWFSRDFERPLRGPLLPL